MLWVDNFLELKIKLSNFEDKTNKFFKILSTIKIFYLILNKFTQLLFKDEKKNAHSHSIFQFNLRD